MKPSDGNLQEAIPLASMVYILYQSPLLAPQEVEYPQWRYGTTKGCPELLGPGDMSLAPDGTSGISHEVSSFLVKIIHFLETFRC